MAQKGDRVREDGTPKGLGFLGALKMKDGSNQDATEYSIGVTIDGQEVLIPTIVPTLSKEEVDFILLGKMTPNNRSDISDSIINKAIAFAQQRKSQGKPFFATKEEEGKFKIGQSMAQYKFNQAEYDKWLRANGLANAKTASERDAARRRYVEEVLIPTYGDNRDVFIETIKEFDKNKPLDKTFKEELITIPTISPSSPANNQGTTPPTPTVGGGKAMQTALKDTNMDRAEALRKSHSAKRTLDTAVEDVEKAQAQKIAGGVAAGTGALKALTGLGQYLGGRKALKALERPEAPVYQTNQNIDTELARLQVLAQSGDPIIRERAMRDIATRQAVAEQAARVGSAGDVSTFASGVAGANIAGMNAARELAADENQRKIQYSAALQSLIGQQTADRQYKNRADMLNFQNDYDEFVRQGDRAAGQMNAGVSNIATGVQDLSLGGASFAGKDAAMNKLLMDFDKMTPEQQAEMVKRYPKLFKMPVTAAKAPRVPVRPPSNLGTINEGLQELNVPTKPYWMSF